MSINYAFLASAMMIVVMAVLLYCGYKDMAWLPLLGSFLILSDTLRRER